MKQNKFQALNEYVQVEKIEEGEKKNKIQLANVTKQKVAKGRVVSKGRGRLLGDGTRVDIPVEVGDTILFNPHLLQEINTGDGKVLIINSTGIYGIIK